MEISTISKPTEPSSIEQNKPTSVRELGYFFLTESSLHLIASDLDVRDHTAMDEILDDVKSYNTDKEFVTIQEIML